MGHEDFVQALTQVYLSNPCQVLPTPLWKMLPRLQGLETAVTHDDQQITRLEAWQGDDLAIYWRRSGRRPSPLINRRLEFQQSAVIHQDFLDAPTVAGFGNFSSFYRLKFEGPLRDVPEAPDEIRLASVMESSGEAQAIAEQIGESGQDSLSGIRDWLNSPNFTPDLWLWAIDDSTEQPVGIGVGEIDSEFREAAILGVQVLPDCRNRGIGRALVQELLRRIGDRASFTTVFGPVEDRENPGAFFRKCGFSGDDVWWFLRRSGD